MKIEDNLYIKKYFSYLKFERNLLDNSVEAYLSDVIKLKSFADDNDITFPFLTRDQITDFLCQLHELNIAPTSQARILSGIKSFYKFLLIEEFIQSNPTDLIESPKLGRKIPEVLTIEEVNLILSKIDVSTHEGQRSRAIIETLYSCGIRVSELCGLSFSHIYKNEGFIMVRGKGEKQRIVPIAESAIFEIEQYLLHRQDIPVQKGQDDFIFLNRRGSALSRISVFTMIKKQCEIAGIKKNVSPHTFRHSFATHLLEGGANLRAIQMMLGHEKITTTEIYTHIDQNLLREEILMHHPRNKKSGGRPATDSE